jgi:hypothetical protein
MTGEGDSHTSESAGKDVARAQALKPSSESAVGQRMVGRMHPVYAGRTPATIGPTVGGASPEVKKKISADPRIIEKPEFPPRPMTCPCPSNCLSLAT